MFTTDSYYNYNTTRKIAACFGDIFNSIHIQRIDDNDVVQKDLLVPISFAPRHKFISRLIEDYNKSAININTTLPRLSFDFDAPVLDAERMSSRYGRCVKKSATDQLVSLMNPVPYNWDFTLRLWTKNLDDALQVTEQILSSCPPSLTFTLVEIDELGVTANVPVILNDNIKVDEYEGDFADFRLIEWEYNFTIKSQLYPQLLTLGDSNNDGNTDGLIKQVNSLLKDIEQVDHTLNDRYVYLDPLDETLWDDPLEPTNVDILKSTDAPI